MLGIREPNGNARVAQVVGYVLLVAFCTVWVVSLVWGGP
jgi:hypothetical protein